MIRWSIADIWNETLLEREREVVARNYIRASEVGTSMLDRYYKMKGEPFTNKFDPRILRVFEAGRLYEWLVRIVLMKSGLLRAEQTEVKIEGNHLPVIGHLDFVAGGKPDWDQSKKILPMLEYLQFPTGMLTVAENLMKQIEEKYPDGLPPLVYDIKSINSMVFWKHNKNESLTTAYNHHALQVYTYMKGLGLKEGRVLYISKDDLTLGEVRIEVDKVLDEQWIRDIMEISNYYTSNTLPESPKPIIWSGKKYELNWMLTRSNYFTKITGIDQGSRDAWDSTMGKLVNRANYRVKAILKNKDTLTASQLQYLCDPYVNQQLEQIRTGKIQIEKEINTDVTDSME